MFLGMSKYQNGTSSMYTGFSVRVFPMLGTIHLTQRDLPRHILLGRCVRLNDYGKTVKKFLSDEFKHLRSPLFYIANTSHLDLPKHVKVSPVSGSVSLLEYPGPGVQLYSQGPLYNQRTGKRTDRRSALRPFSFFRIHDLSKIRDRPKGYAVRPGRT